MHGGITSKAVRAVCYSALGRIARTLVKSRDNEMSCVCCSQWGSWIFFLGLNFESCGELLFHRYNQGSVLSLAHRYLLFSVPVRWPGITDFAEFCLFQVEIERDGSWWVAQPPCAIYSILCATLCTLWLVSRILESLCRGEREYGLNFPPMSPTGDIGMWRHCNILGKRMISFW